MARLTPQRLAYQDLQEPVKIVCPLGWQKAERAIIRLFVRSRDSRIGTIDLSRIIPREFTGYWYLYKDKYQFDSGKIDFKTQEIYRDLDLWKAEIVSQQMAQRVPIIEVTQPEENLEESLEFALFVGEVIAGLAADLPDIVFIDNFVQILTDFFANLSSDNLTYLPTPYRPDTLYIDFPSGLASVDVEFIWFPFSPIAVGSGAAELPIENAVTPISVLPDSSVTEPEQASQAKTFEQRAIENGFVPNSRLPQACQNLGFTAPLSLGNQMIADSNISPSALLSELLANGAINQADIDEIKAIHPSENDGFILSKLLESGEVSIPELSKAISDYKESQYQISGYGKRIFWGYVLKSNNSSCQQVGTIYRFYYNTNAVYNWSVLPVSAAILGTPTAASINWGAIPYEPPYLPPVRWSAELLGTSCGRPDYNMQLMWNPANYPLNVAHRAYDSNIPFVLFKEP